MTLADQNRVAYPTSPSLLTPNPKALGSADGIGPYMHGRNEIARRIGRSQVSDDIHGRQ